MCDRQGAEGEIAKIYHNRYQTQKLLGEGGMGKVYLAKDLKTGKKVAVKVLKNETQWKQEKEILNKLKDVKGVPELFLAENENMEAPFLVMEYIKGQSLKTYQTFHGDISEKTFVRFMYKVCKVLERIHKRGVVHMDLKPENIILHPSGRLYLIDFGVSIRKGDSLTGYGTRIYASKRQTKAGEKAAFFMDIYSIGRIMQLNAGQNRSDSLKKIIEKSICEDEKKNYQSVVDMKKDLGHILWKKETGKCAVLFVCFGIMYIFCFADSDSGVKEKTKVQSVAVHQNIYRKGLNYFYGNDKIEKDLILAEQYLKKEQTKKESAKAYLLLILVLDDPEKEVPQKDLIDALKICQKDVHDFWSAYFFAEHFILWHEKLPETFLKKAEKLLREMEKSGCVGKQQKLIEKQRLNLYEIMAQKGDTTSFFKETDRVFHERFKENEAWELYERKLLFLSSKSVDMEYDFERFMKRYPKVMEVYIEYGIYLCQKNQIEKAKDVYLQGLKITGMTSDRAKALRRKLGL